MNHTETGELAEGMGQRGHAGKFDQVGRDVEIERGTR